MRLRLKNALSYTQMIVLGFLLINLIGAGLLCLPAAARDGISTPFVDSLFTATSATCVTGLVVVDTYTHWSLFGQIVILCLIQVGGLGLMTVITLFTLFLRRRVSMRSRRLAMQSVGNIKISGTVTLIKRISVMTLTMEAVGALMLGVRFVPKMGWGTGAWYAVFHSISAYCNAGFDIMGAFSQSSLCAYVNDPLVNITVMLLIISGGLGFLVWSDLFSCGWHTRRYSLNTRIVLVATGALVVGGAVVLYFTERNNAFLDMTTGERWLAAFFQSVTTRTAGYNTVVQSSLSETGSILSMVLMFIGGSPGSTAGGIKTTTFVVLVLGTVCDARNDKYIVTFKRRIENDTLRQCSAIANLYLFAVILASMAICSLEGLGLRVTLYEVISAIGTVGLSMGITPLLGAASRLILVGLMFMGRVGALSLAVAFAEKRNHVPLERPTEKILVG